MIVDDSLTIVDSTHSGKLRDPSHYESNLNPSLEVHVYVLYFQKTNDTCRAGKREQHSTYRHVSLSFRSKRTLRWRYRRCGSPANGKICMTLSQITASSSPAYIFWRQTTTACGRKRAFWGIFSSLIVTLSEIFPFKPCLRPSLA